jgi:hypothetical protein
MENKIGNQVFSDDRVDMVVTDRRISGLANNDQRLCVAVSHAARFKDVALEILLPHFLLDGLKDFKSAGSPSARGGADENHGCFAIP